SFCLICCGPPRALPSFPTRRSSDLVDLAPRHVQDAPRQRGIVGELTRLQRFLRLRQLADGLLRGEDARARGLVLGAFAGGGAEGDRKSTRLNSSHVASSYAVFCLKK